MRNVHGKPQTETHAPGARIRGSVVASRLAYVTTRWGEAGRRVLLAKLTAKERKRVESVALDGDWFDYATLDVLDRTIVGDLARGDPSVLHELGRASATYNLERLMSTRVSGLDTRTTIARVGRLNLFQDFGDASCESLDDGVALTYTYPTEVTDVYCASALGFFEGVLLALGCEDARVTEVTCQGRSGHAHRYELRWREPSPPSHGGTRPVACVDTSNEAERDESWNERERRLDLAVAALYRGVLDRDDEMAGTRVEVRKAPTRRSILLFLTVMILAAVAVVRWISVMAPVESKHPHDPIRNYARSGELELDLQFDRPELRLKTTSQLAEATLTIHQFGKAFVLTLASVPGDSYLEADVASFTAADGTHPDTTKPPTLLTVLARIDGKVARCEFRLE